MDRKFAAQYVEELCTIRASVVAERRADTTETEFVAKCPICGDRLSVSIDDAALEDSKSPDKVLIRSMPIRDWLHDHDCVPLDVARLTNAELDRQFAKAETRWLRLADKVDTIRKEIERRK